MTCTTTTLPNTGQDTFFTWLKQIRDKIPEHYTSHWYQPKETKQANLEYAQVLNTLNEMIPQWKNECSSDITHFRSILNLQIKYNSLMSRVLYACMEQNETNRTFLHSIITSNLTTVSIEYQNTVSQTNYPTLHNIIKDTSMDFSTFYYGSTIQCFQSLMPYSMEFKKLSIKDPLDLHMLNYIFKDPNLYTELLTYGDEASLYMSQSIGSILSFFSIIRNPNIGFVFDSLEIIFPKTADQLMFLTGMSLLTDTQAYAGWKEELDQLYISKYPAEFKMMNTLKSLDIKDLTVMIPNLILAAPANDIIPVELPIF